jgi:maleate isomerase
MACITPASLVAAARQACDPAAEALFISCTAVRAAEVAGRIEDELDKPVVTSNQAMVWRALRLAGCPLPVPGYGRLLQ